MPEVADKQRAGTDKLAQRFWSKVDRRDADMCWIWTGGVGRSGYGLFWDGDKVRTASRMAYLFAKSDPGNLQVHHTCDNPLCCNPDHLWAGTHTENMRDMISKGRNKVKRSVTEQQRENVRRYRQDGMSIAEIVRKSGLNIKTVKAILVLTFPE